MGAKQVEERAFREAVEKDPKLRQSAGGAWDEVARAVCRWGEVYQQSVLLEQGAAFRCDLFQIARTLVRIAEEDKKANADRLREYRQSNRESMEQALFSEAPIYEDLEIVKLANALSYFMEHAGAENELVRKVLAGKSPPERAAELVKGTKLRDVAVRRQLARGGSSALDAAHDPMIELARQVDEPARAVRKITEEEVDEPLRQAYARLATARFAVSWTEVYPDATFTLRLAFGQVKGYRSLGRDLPPWTTIGGAFDHAAAHEHREPFALPASWLKAKGQLDLATPLNLVATPDIIGGNSGSPVVDRKGQLVGIIFDGNIPSLVWDFVYTEEEGRAIAVDSRGILESLRKIYHAQDLVEELRQPE